VKMYLKDVRYYGVDRVQLAQNRVQSRILEDMEIIVIGCVKDKGYLDRLTE
jgi:hypothetical protein